jgi:predicted ester cyclase
MPDTRHIIDLELVDRDYVVLHTRASGTNTGPGFHGEPPTGRPAEWVETHIFRMRDDRIAEHWAIVKVDSILAQLGLIHIDGPVPPAL